jgi:hypothetical protein
MRRQYADKMAMKRQHSNSQSPAKFDQTSGA